MQSGMAIMEIAIWKFLRLADASLKSQGSFCQTRLKVVSSTSVVTTAIPPLAYRHAHHPGELTSEVDERRLMSPASDVFVPA